ncbi:MAG TPA: ABC transporter permease, partial [Firmicutes bacterium]|nr:ABC transporter permease [Bacillota bacterium]
GATNFGGSNNKMWITVVGYIYYYQTDKIGQASAAAVILLLIILLITGVQMLVSKKRVHY